ncbi:MAG: 2OG-Fe(II) oxygenase family protein [Pseudomonadota bacterium]
MTFPTIDLQTPNADALRNACQEWGFFALRGHGVPADLLADAEREIHAFFALSAQEKNRIRRSAQNSWGYYDAELTKNRRDWKEIFDLGAPATFGPLAGATPQWPDAPGFRVSIDSLRTHLHRVALEVTDAIVATIDPQAQVRTAFADHSSFLRVNFYPPCPNPAPADADFVPTEGELGISHHTDAGAVTVLWQDDQPGLQMYRNGAWQLVESDPDELIINIGDIVQVWSNDAYRAPLHRVLANDSKARYSIPYFLNPDYAYVYAPLGTATPRYRGINWGEFRAGRSAGDYADVGEEIQISQYRIAADV